MKSSNAAQAYHPGVKRGGFPTRVSYSSNSQKKDFFLIAVFLVCFRVLGSAFLLDGQRRSELDCIVVFIAQGVMVVLKSVPAHQPLHISKFQKFADDNLIKLLQIA